MALSFDRFAELAETYNVIPFVREEIADSETPIALARRLSGRGPFYLLESVEGGEKWGRFSILGFGIEKYFSIEDGAGVLREGDQETRFDGNPVDALQTYLAQFHACEMPGLPRFFGGAVGYFSFESVRFFERCGEVKPNTTSFPDAQFFISDRLAVFDNISHTLKLVCCVHPGEHDSLEAAHAYGLQALDEMETLLHSDPLPTPTPDGREIDLQMNMSMADYQAMVERTRQYIVDGDVIQAVVAQHFSADISATPLDVYRALRHINPSPYMYFLDFDDGRAIAGSSPEVMVRVTDDRAEIRPIAGTRPRGKTPKEDQLLAEELLADPKERAEHVMLVDLARNDLGRIAEIGSIAVKEYMIIERYSHVMHIVSQVEGTVRDEFDAIDVFKASFPAGTLSGAPKVRAMEIINELEPDPRGPYGGALGYITYGGKIMDVAITIRTVVIDGSRATVTAGAGIVFDSVPETEYHETRHKSRGMRQALQLAENGLHLEGGNPK